MTAQFEWKTSQGLTEYDHAIEVMQARIEAIRDGTAKELVWLLEHPPVYTAGTSASQDELLDPGDALIRYVGRGGEWTYHGPGQRVVYIMLDLNKRGRDVRQFVRDIEAVAIDALKQLEITGERIKGTPGVWIPSTPPEKIVAVGVRVTKWVSWHGMAVNLAPDLDAFNGIVPCGLHNAGVTSIARLRPRTSMAELDDALFDSFAERFSSD